MSIKKDNLQRINSARNRAILRYINRLSFKVTELYEALIDNEIDDALIIQKELTSELRSLKIEEDKM